MVISLQVICYLKNGPFKNMVMEGWFYMPYLKPTINLNMLQFISSSVSQVINPLQVSNCFIDLQADFLVDLNPTINFNLLQYTKSAVIHRV